jgi:hypothetical protein
VRSGALAGACALLAACGGVPGVPGVASRPTSPAATSGRSALVTLPTVQPPASAPPPDFPGSTDGVVEPGYVNWPRTTFQSVKQAPVVPAIVGVLLYGGLVRFTRHPAAIFSVISAIVFVVTLIPDSPTSRPSPAHPTHRPPSWC